MSKAKSTHDPSHRPEERPSDSGQKAARSGGSLARREAGGLTDWAPSSPFSFMRRFSEEMDRLFEDFGVGGFGLAPASGGSFGARSWSPQVDVLQREGRLVVRVDLPGMTKDDVKVELENDSITIHGERRSEHEENREGYYRSERSYGRFVRTIPLPEGVKGEEAKASFRNGVLEITMPAPKRTAARRLEIEEGGASK